MYTKISDNLELMIEFYKHCLYHVMHYNQNHISKIRIYTIYKKIYRVNFNKWINVLQ